MPLRRRNRGSDLQVEIYVGDRPLSSLTPEERQRLGGHVARVMAPAVWDYAERELRSELAAQRSRLASDRGACSWRSPGLAR